MRHPHRFFWPQVVLFGLCVTYTVFFLKADMNRIDLVGPNQQYHHTSRSKRSFRLNDLVVVVESGDIEDNRQFVERIAAKMQAETNLFQDVFYQQSMSMMGDKALQFAETTNLVAMRDTLGAARPFIEKFAQTTNLISLFEEVNRSFRTAKQETNAQNKSLLGSLPALARIVSQANDALLRPGVPPSPNVVTLLDSGHEAVLSSYLTFDHGHIFVVTCHAPNDDMEGQVINRLRELVHETRSEMPGLNVGLTGEPVLEYDESPSGPSTIPSWPALPR